MTTTAEELNAVLAAATAGAGLPYLVMRVVFDDGTEYHSRADQRDMRRAMVATGADPHTDPLGFSRACAWSYLTRTDVLAMGWAEFDRDVAFVIPPPAEDAPETADPTRPATAG
jgi:hypothetical protein